MGAYHVHHLIPRSMTQVDACEVHKPMSMPTSEVHKPMSMPTSVCIVDVRDCHGSETLSLEAALASLEGITELPLVEDFICILRKCREKRHLGYAKRAHMHIHVNGLEALMVVGNYLIPMYMECGSVMDAHRVFARMVDQNEYSWTSLILGYIGWGECWHAFDLFQGMQLEGVQPSPFTFLALVKACTRLKCIGKGQELHADVVKEGFDKDRFLGSGLVDMYAKCGLLAEGQAVFDELLVRDVVLWNTLIAAYADCGLGEKALTCLEQMQLEGMILDDVTLLCSLKACGSIGAIARGREIHAEIAKEGFERDAFIGSTLVDMYAKCGSLEEAQHVFDELPVRALVSWTALMAGYAEHGPGAEALNCLVQMQQEGLSPDAVAYVCSLKACGSIKAIGSGKEIHAELIKLGFEGDLFVSSTLVDMYAKCGSLSEARAVFDKIQVRVAVSWTALIEGYAEHGLCEEALEFMEEMQLEGIYPDAVTFVSSLKACTNAGAIERGLEIHSKIAEEGLETDPFSGNTLVDFYIKSGLLAEASAVFDELPVRDAFSWNTLLAGYAEHGLSDEAFNCLEQMHLEAVFPDVLSWSAVILVYVEQGEDEKALLLYARMQEQGILPNNVTFLSILKACSNIATLDLGKRIHAQAFRADGVEAADVNMTTALIDMYGKCGSRVDTQQVFDAMPARDLVAWNAVMTGYARLGESELVFQSFQKMRNAGLQPDEITFLNVLTVCSHAGLISKGHKYFESMNTEYGVAPTPEHHNCMADLLSRAGQLDEAVATLDKMSFQADVVSWSTVLAACRKWGNLELGRQAFEFVMTLDEKHGVAFIMMANIYSDDHIWE